MKKILTLILLFITKIYCKLKGVHFGSNLRSYGFPLIKKAKKAKIILGDNVVLTSLSVFNPAGINHRVILCAPNDESEIIIGNNTGISGTTIVASKKIIIGNYVNIGVNSCIYDTDFHPIDPKERRSSLSSNIKSNPIIIEDNVFIGANVIILKGVRIGKDSIIGAGSVVTKDIPERTIWAGNPAKLIKKL